MNITSMNKKKNRGLIYTQKKKWIFNIQRFAYQKVSNPYKLNAKAGKEYRAKADISSGIYNISKLVPFFDDVDDEDSSLPFFLMDLVFPFSQIPDTTITDDMTFTIGTISTDNISIPDDYYNIRINATLNSQGIFRFLDDRVIKYTPVTPSGSHTPAILFTFSYRNSPGYRIKSNLMKSNTIRAIEFNPISISASVKGQGSQSYYDIINYETHNEVYDSTNLGLDHISQLDEELYEHILFLIENGLILSTRYVNNNVFNIFTLDFPASIGELNTILRDQGNTIFLDTLLEFDLMSNLAGAYYNARNISSLSFEFEYGPDIEKLTPDYDNRY